LRAPAADCQFLALGDRIFEKFDPFGLAQPSLPSRKIEVIQRDQSWERRKPFARPIESRVTIENNNPNVFLGLFGACWNSRVFGNLNDLMPRRKRAQTCFGVRRPVPEMIFWAAEPVYPRVK
jgi:hypothetical protein